MKNKVLETIKKYNLINSNDKIVIGVSGGPDSISLLNILNDLRKEMNFEIVVAHINHMIRPEADDETKYVIDFCNNINVDCYVKKVDVIGKAQDEKMGTEETGRKVRYEFFEEVLEKTGANKIATAHNKNDNAETVLMNIFRGTGTTGLKGIEPIRNGKFIRPLIECQRNEIEKYCEIKKLNPKIDSSNFENIYTRNKVRNILIPQLKNEFNPNVIEAINKLSLLVREEDNFIQNYINKLLNEELIIKNFYDEDLNFDNNDIIVLDLKKFNSQDKFIKSKIILLTIQNLLGNSQGIEKVHIEDIIMLCEKNIGNKYLSPNKRIKILVKKGKIIFIKTLNN